jgi:hypothetical protein
MKLELTKGCIYDSFEVNGNPIKDCDESQLKQMLTLATQKICSKEFAPHHRYFARVILRKMVKHFHDTLEYSYEPCECCGNNIETYTMEVYNMVESLNDEQLAKVKAYIHTL